MKEIVQITISREQLELVLGTLTLYMSGCRGDYEMYMGAAGCLTTLFTPQDAHDLFVRLHDAFVASAPEGMVS